MDNLTLKALYKQFIGHPEGNWIMIWENAQELYKFVMENPVKRVLDLGTGIGCSAAIVALAFRDKEEDYHIDSIEQFDKCIKIAKELIPEELLKNTTIHKIEPEVWIADEMPYTYFSVYKELPSWDYDVIVNDGPSPWMEGQKYIDLPNGTIHKALVEGKLKEDTYVIWDGRISALRLLERFFGENFYLTKIARRPDGDFNVVQRKKGEFKVNDLRMEKATEYGYFNPLKTESEIKPQESLSPESPHPQK